MKEQQRTVHFNYGQTRGLYVLTTAYGDMKFFCVVVTQDKDISHEILRIVLIDLKGKEGGGELIPNSPNTTPLFLAKIDKHCIWQSENLSSPTPHFNPTLMSLILTTFKIRH